LVISNHNSFRVLFDKIASVYFIFKIYLYYSILILPIRTLLGYLFIVEQQKPMNMHIKTDHPIHARPMLYRRRCSNQIDISCTPGPQQQTAGWDRRTHEQTDRHTDGRTDARHKHRPCCDNCAGIAGGAHRRTMARGVYAI